LIVPQEWDPQGGPVAEPLRKLSTHRKFVAGSNKVMNMDRSSIHNSAASHPTAHKRYRELSNRTCEGYVAMVRDQAETFAKHLIDPRVVRIAQASRTRRYFGEHVSQVRRRT
jgi:hypothetical protein